MTNGRVTSLNLKKYLKGGKIVGFEIIIIIYTYISGVCKIADSEGGKPVSAKHKLTHFMTQKVCQNVHDFQRSFNLPFKSCVNLRQYKRLQDRYLS